MPVRANISSRYRGRWGLMALFCFGFTLWFLYDGSITYPNQRARALKYQELQDEGRLDEWEIIAAENGWPSANPGEPKTEHDIGVQFAMAATAAPVGLVFLVLFLVSRGRWMEGDENGIKTSWGQEVQFSQITGLDKKLWRNKGIAKITYQENGKKRRLALDDFKYDREATEEMLRAVESHLDDDQIVGGPPEPPPGEEDETEQQAAGPSGEEAAEMAAEPTAEAEKPDSKK